MGEIYGIIKALTQKFHRAASFKLNQVPRGNSPKKKNLEQEINDECFVCFFFLFVADFIFSWLSSACSHEVFWQSSGLVDRVALVLCVVRIFGCVLFFLLVHLGIPLFVVDTGRPS